jgi:hypothetical protein
MARALQTASGIFLKSAARKTRVLNRERLPIFYGRIALGAAFLSGIASRFGLYGKNVGYGKLHQLREVYGGSELVPACLPDSFFGMVGYGRRIGFGNRLDSRGGPEG